MTHLPFVSIIVLCRNEKGFIAACLDSLLANDYPNDRLEIIIADGMSDDGTRDIVRAYSKQHSIVKLVDNPGRIPPAAANQGIRVAKGELIMIAGAHARYPVEYVSKTVSYAQSFSNADNVGGVRLTEPREKTVVGKSIAFIVSHRLGGGAAGYHHASNSPRWVESVWGGCYRREVFERLGPYNEALRVGEDREFNQRLRESGGRILLVPEIKCTYYARSGFREYCRWAFGMGFWPFHAGKLVGRQLSSLRNFVPLSFVMSVFLSLGASWRFPSAWYLLGGISLTYVLGCLASSFSLVIRERDPRYLIATPFIFGTTHILYGLGSIYGILKPARRTEIRVRPGESLTPSSESLR